MMEFRNASRARGGGDVLKWNTLENEEASPFKAGSDPEISRGKKSGGTGFYLRLARRAPSINPDCDTESGGDSPPNR
jgi:hypothetical protein